MGSIIRIAHHRNSQYREQADVKAFSHAEDVMAPHYRPTSLDFINLPNPVEPHTTLQQHPLNHTSRLNNHIHDSINKEEVYRRVPFALGSDYRANHHQAKRIKLNENAALDLPRLPVRQEAKRIRIPPTLSGLHQPPPDAGLLPSITTEKRKSPAASPPAPAVSRPVAEANELAIVEGTATSKSTASEVVKPVVTVRRSKQNKWTEVETEHLLRGVAQFGVGSWTKILKHPEFSFDRRTAMDLKDRFRVCCPKEYKPNTNSDRSKPKTLSRKERVEATASAGVSESTGGVTVSKLKLLGIDQPFAETSRRSRHAYTEDEDRAILTGFRKYGKSWTSIKQDDALGLGSRQATDLRDRMRTRYPDVYAAAASSSGRAAEMAIEPRISSSQPKSGDVSRSRPNTPRSASKMNSLAPSGGASTSLPVLSDSPLKSRKSKQNDPAVSVLFDPFAGFEAQYNLNDDEPITLDRTILDWAAVDTSKPGGTEMTRSNTNDGFVAHDTSMTTTRQNFTLPAAHTSSSSATQATHSFSISSLPALAPLTYNHPAMASGDQFEQLELPSLMTYINGPDKHGISLEDLLV